MKVPLLTYHAMNIHGNDYANNDHVAFRDDLEHLDRLGFEILPLREIVEHAFGEADALAGRRVVGLACDDGSDFDARDLVHPTHGPQRSMLNILRDFRAAHPGAQPRLHLTSFVVVSPQARRQLDTTCMVGAGWWNDDWWDEAIASGLIGIGNHSWDHNHDTLCDVRAFEARRGTFVSVDSAEKAQYEIVQAAEYLALKAPNESSALFAYPYGECNDFLVDTWFPRQQGRFLAAFTTERGYVRIESNRWRLPRFTCGLDWGSPAALERILAG